MRAIWSCHSSRGPSASGHGRTERSARSSRRALARQSARLEAQLRSAAPERGRSACRSGNSCVGRGRIRKMTPSVIEAVELGGVRRCGSGAIRRSSIATGPRFVQGELSLSLSESSSRQSNQRMQRTPITVTVLRWRYRGAADPQC